MDKTVNQRKGANLDSELSVYFSDRQKIVDFIPDNVLFQWHITERCNGNCLHCYQSGDINCKEPSFEELLHIFQQFLEFLDECDGLRKKGKTKGHITITGGEPFMREDIFDLLDIFAFAKRRLTFAILTNATLIDDRCARYLSLQKPEFIQASIDGKKETHDYFRSKGDFENVCGGIGRLVNNQVNTMISFTANRMNFREFPEVCNLGKKLGVNTVWSDRLIPIGTGERMSEVVLTTEETREYVEIVSRMKHSFPGNFGTTRVAAHRALQALGTPHCYNCKAGSTLLTVMPNGDLVPCRRMPIQTGNLFQESLAEIYWKNDLLRKLRSCEKKITGCEKCGHLKSCRGGLRCLAYALHGDPFRADPGCWLANF